MSVDGVSRLVSAITAVVSDVRLCLSLMMENPSGYTRLIRTLWLLYGVFVKWTALSCLFVCVFVVHTHAGESHDQSINPTPPPLGPKLMHESLNVTCAKRSLPVLHCTTMVQQTYNCTTTGQVCVCEFFFLHTYIGHRQVPSPWIGCHGYSSCSPAWLDEKASTFSTCCAMLGRPSLRPSTSP